jgi:hypothetical protein
MSYLDCRKVFSPDEIASLTEDQLRDIEEKLMQMQKAYSDFNVSKEFDWSQTPASTWLGNAEFENWINNNYNFKGDEIAKEILDNMSIEEFALNVVFKDVTGQMISEFNEKYVVKVKAAYAKLADKDAMKKFKTDAQFEKVRNSNVPWWNPIKKASQQDPSAGKYGQDNNLFFHIMVNKAVTGPYQFGHGLEDIMGAYESKYFFNDIIELEDIFAKDLDGAYADLKIKYKDDVIKAMNSDEVSAEIFQYRQGIAKGELTDANGNLITSGMKDGLAKEVVIRVYNGFRSLREQGRLLGSDITELQFAGKPVFLESKVLDKNQFIDDFMEFVDDDIVSRYEGRPITDAGYIKTQKEILARRYVNDIINKTDSFAFGFKGEYKRNSRYLLFKDGASELAMRKKYGADETFTHMYHETRTLIKEHSMTQMFGSDPMAYIKEYKNLLRTDSQTAHLADSKAMRWFENYIKAKMTSHIDQSSYWGNVFTSLRNWNIGKLGNLIFDQSIVEPFQAVSLMKQAGVKGASWWKLHPLFGSLNKVYRHSKNMTRKEARAYTMMYSKKMNISNEHMFGTTRMKMYEATDHFGNPQSWTGRSEQFANWYLRKFGVTYMSDMQAANATGILRSNVTDWLDTGKKWADLKNADEIRWKQELQRHGMTEQLYNQTLSQWNRTASKLKEQDGLFDIFAFDLNTDRRVITRTGDLFTVWHKYLKTNVDAMGRTRPTELQRLFLTGYAANPAERDALISLAKNLTQFKSFSVTVGQKNYGRAFQEEGGYGVIKMFARLGVATLVPAMLYVQARQLGEGKAPYTYEDPRWLEETITRMPFLGMFAVFPAMELIIRNMIRGGYIAAGADDVNLSTGRDFTSDLWRNLLGPTTGYIEDIYESVTDIPSKMQKKGFVEGGLQGGENLVRNTLKYLFPTGPVVSIFKQEFFDTLEYYLDHSSWRKRQTREVKDAKQQRIQDLGQNKRGKWFSVVDLID